VALTEWLIDKSALVRLSGSPDSEIWRLRIERGLVRISNLTRLEVGYSAKSFSDLERTIKRPPLSLMPTEYLTPTIEDRAVEVQLEMARLGNHRAPSIADLLIAAAADLAGLTVLHLDKDFELISATTGQPTERLRVP
jgi:predicted nucleic acid-binding protein